MIVKLAVYQICHCTSTGTPWRHAHFKQLRLQMLHKIIYSNVDISLPITYRTKHTYQGQWLQSDTAVDAYKYSFFPVSIHLWNNVPRDIINVITYRYF